MSQQFTSYSYTFKNIGYIAVSAISLLFISKSLIRRNRDNDYKTDVRIDVNKMDNTEADEELNRKYSKIARESKVEYNQNNEDQSQVKKSEYLGVGSSYMSRRQGDRLGFWDRKD